MLINIFIILQFLDVLEGENVEDYESYRSRTVNIRYSIVLGVLI